MKPSKTISHIESSPAFDPLVGAVSAVAEPAFQKWPTIRDALRGEWMDHPLHPLMTVGTIGLFSAASVLDVFGDKTARSASQRLIGFGILSAAPTALAGLSEWATRTEDAPQRRVGIVHALSNTAALALYGASWCERRRGNHRRGAMLAATGSVVMGAGGYLGGHLTYQMGVGVLRD